MYYMFVPDARRFSSEPNLSNQSFDYLTRPPRVDSVIHTAYFSEDQINKFTICQNVNSMSFWSQGCYFAFNDEMAPSALELAPYCQAINNAAPFFKDEQGKVQIDFKNERDLKLLHLSFNILGDPKSWKNYPDEDQAILLQLISSSIENFEQFKKDVSSDLDRASVLAGSAALIGLAAPPLAPIITTSATIVGAVSSLAKEAHNLVSDPKYIDRDFLIKFISKSVLTGSCLNNLTVPLKLEPLATNHLQEVKEEFNRAANERRESETPARGWQSAERVAERTIGPKAAHSQAVPSVAAEPLEQNLADLKELEVDIKTHLRLIANGKEILEKELAELDSNREKLNSGLENTVKFGQVLAQALYQYVQTKHDEKRHKRALESLRTEIDNAYKYHQFKLNIESYRDASHHYSLPQLEFEISHQYMTSMYTNFCKQEKYFEDLIQKREQLKESLTKGQQDVEGYKEKSRAYYEKQKHFAEKIKDLKQNGYLAVLPQVLAAAGSLTMSMNPIVGGCLSIASLVGGVFASHDRERTAKKMHKYQLFINSWQNLSQNMGMLQQMAQQGIFQNSQQIDAINSSVLQLAGYVDPEKYRKDLFGQLKTMQTELVNTKNAIVKDSTTHQNLIDLKNFLLEFKRSTSSQKKALKNRLLVRLRTGIPEEFGSLDHSDIKEGEDLDKYIAIIEGKLGELEVQLASNSNDTNTLQKEIPALEKAIKLQNFLKPYTDWRYARLKDLGIADLTPNQELILEKLRFDHQMYLEELTLQQQTTQTINGVLVASGRVAGACGNLNIQQALSAIETVYGAWVAYHLMTKRFEWYSEGFIAKKLDPTDLKNWFDAFDNAFLKTPNLDLEAIDPFEILREFVIPSLNNAANIIMVGVNLLNRMGLTQIEPNPILKALQTGMNGLHEHINHLHAHVDVRFNSLEATLKGHDAKLNDIKFSVRNLFKLIRRSAEKGQIQIDDLKREHEETKRQIAQAEVNRYQGEIDRTINDFKSSIKGNIDGNNGQIIACFKDTVVTYTTETCLDDRYNSFSFKGKLPAYDREPAYVVRALAHAVSYPGNESIPNIPMFLSALKQVNVALARLQANGLINDLQANGEAAIVLKVVEKLISQGEKIEKFLLDIGTNPLWIQRACTNINKSFAKLLKIVKSHRNAFSKSIDDSVESSDLASAAEKWDEMRGSGLIAADKFKLAELIAAPYAVNGEVPSFRKRFTCKQLLTPDELLFLPLINSLYLSKLTQSSIQKIQRVLHNLPDIAQMDSNSGWGCKNKDSYMAKLVFSPVKGQFTTTIESSSSQASYPLSIVLKTQASSKLIDIKIAAMYSTTVKVVHVDNIFINNQVLTPDQVVLFNRIRPPYPNAINMELDIQKKKSLIDAYKMDYKKSTIELIDSYAKYMAGTNQVQLSNSLINGVSLAASIYVSPVNNDHIPLLFPKGYIDDLLKHEALSPICEQIKTLPVSSIRFSYSLIPKESDTYHLVLTLFCLGSEEEHYYLASVPIAYFNALTVKAYKKFTHDYKYQENSNEFLLFAMYGTPPNTGFPTNRTTDIDGRGAICPVEEPFVGLYRLLPTLGNRSIFVQDDDKHYSYSGWSEIPLQDAMIVVEDGFRKLNEKEELRKLSMEFFRELRTKEDYTEEFHRVQCHYETLISLSKLISNSDTDSARYLIKKDLNIHDPALLRTVGETNTMHYLASLKQGKQPIQDIEINKMLKYFASIQNHSFLKELNQLKEWKKAFCAAPILQG